MRLRISCGHHVVISFMTKTTLYALKDIHVHILNGMSVDGYMIYI